MTTTETSLTPQRVEMASSIDAQACEAHQSYTEEALGRSFSGLLSELPNLERQRLSDSLFFKIAELERTKAHPAEMFAEIFLSTYKIAIADVFKGVGSDRVTLIEKLVGMIEDDSVDEVDYDALYTTAELMDVTKSSRTTVQRMLKENQLIAVRLPNDRSNHFPVWQVSNGRFLQGLGDVLNILQLSGQEAVSVLTAEVSGEDGKCIVDLLYEKDIDAALGAARHEVHYQRLTSSKSKSGADFLFSASAADIGLSYEPGRTEKP